MSTPTYEPIAVVASFHHGKVKPVLFLWKGKKILIDQISFEWQTQQGASRLFHFTAVASRTLYLLVFDTIALRWTLEGIECEQKNITH